MLRYNQAWLLDNNNYLVYWGFGEIQAFLNKLDESVEFMRRALELCDDTYQLTGLCADFAAILAAKARSLPPGQDAERSALLKEAETLIEKGIQLNPDWGANWRAWCIILTLQEKYAEAAEKLSKARQLGARALPDDIAQKLATAIQPPPSS
jgi:tetratricopeptide (TPR) repeat protein